jgi:excisionase family DNA binding protein
VIAHSLVITAMATIENAAAVERANEGLLTKQELAKRLRRSPRTVDAWMREGRLPYLKVSKSVLFDWGDVLAKLKSFRVN